MSDDEETELPPWESLTEPEKLDILRDFLGNVAAYAGSLLREVGLEGKVPFIGVAVLSREGPVVQMSSPSKTPQR